MPDPSNVELASCTPATSIFCARVGPHAHMFKITYRHFLWSHLGEIFASTAQAQASPGPQPPLPAQGAS
jgi:hypothetical protein